MFFFFFVFVSLYFIFKKEKKEHGSSRIDSLPVWLCLCSAAGQVSGSNRMDESEKKLLDLMDHLSTSAQQIRQRPHNQPMHPPRQRRYVFMSHRLFRGDDAVIMLWFLRLLLSLAVGQQQRRQPVVRPAHLPLSLPCSSSGIKAQLTDGVTEPSLQGADGVTRTSGRGVRAGAGAARGLVGPRASGWADVTVTACHGVGFCCRCGGKCGLSLKHSS